MDDLQARKTAAAWHGGQTSELYKLCSSGAIENAKELHREIFLCLALEEDDQAIDELLDLDDYITATGERGPVPGWSDLLW